jgi:hypothetical protein
MESLYALAAVQQGLELMRRQFDMPESRHLAEALAARDPWRHRFMRQVRRLKLLASQSSQPAATATEGY